VEISARIAPAASGPQGISSMPMSFGPTTGAVPPLRELTASPFRGWPPRFT